MIQQFISLYLRKDPEARLNRALTVFDRARHDLESAITAAERREEPDLARIEKARLAFEAAEARSRQRITIAQNTAAQAASIRDNLTALITPTTTEHA